MNRILRQGTRAVGWLLLAAALVLPGCKKAPPPAAEQQGPKTNPVLPPLGQPIEGGGVVQDVRRAVRRTADINQLANFSLAYFQARQLNNAPPSRLEELKDSLDANTVAAFQEGFYVAVWNVRDGSSDTVVAYVKDPDTSGTRIVATADGKARRMNQQEFDAALQKR
jgi:hypothetical protein